MLAAFAGAALTILARGNLKASDLTANLGNAAAAVVYATLGAVVIRRAGNLMGWLMFGESAGLAFLNLASTYAVLGVATFPGALPAAKQAGTAAEVSFAGIAFAMAFMTQALPVSLSAPAAAAIATLAAAAQFSPLRRRVQRIVDRRFNRARYDAESTVAAFAARLKDTVDLDSFRDDLAGVVHQALEPATSRCGSGNTSKPGPPSPSSRRARGIPDHFGAHR